MGITAVEMDCITEKSGHTMTPVAVSVCTTPAAPSPLPIPYPPGRERRRGHEGLAVADQDGRREDHHRGSVLQGLSRE